MVNREFERDPVSILVQKNEFFRNSGSSSYHYSSADYNEEECEISVQVTTSTTQDAIRVRQAIDPQMSTLETLPGRVSHTSANVTNIREAGNKFHNPGSYIHFSGYSKAPALFNNVYQIQKIELSIDAYYLQELVDRV